MLCDTCGKESNISGRNEAWDAGCRLKLPPASRDGLVKGEKNSHYMINKINSGKTMLIASPPRRDDEPRTADVIIVLLPAVELSPTS